MLHNTVSGYHNSPKHYRNYFCIMISITAIDLAVLLNENMLWTNLKKNFYCRLYQKIKYLKLPRNYMNNTGIPARMSCLRPMYVEKWTFQFDIDLMLLWQLHNSPKMIEFITCRIIYIYKKILIFSQHICLNHFAKQILPSYSGITYNIIKEVLRKCITCNTRKVTIQLTIQFVGTNVMHIILINLGNWLKVHSNEY